MLEDEKLAAYVVDEDGGDDQRKLRHQGIDAENLDHPGACEQAPDEADATDEEEINNLGHATVAAGGEYPEDIGDIGNGGAENEGDAVVDRAV